SASFYFLTTSDTKAREAVISNLSVFAQDAWRATDRLVLTFGLRLDRVPPPTEGTGRLPRTLLGIEKDRLQSPRLAAPGTPLWHGRFGELAPRLGWAYELSRGGGWETSLRGG